MNLNICKCVSHFIIFLIRHTFHNTFYTEFEQEHYDVTQTTMFQSKFCVEFY